MSNSRRDLWSELKASGKGDGRLEIPSLATDVDTGYGKVRYSLGENGERRLLIPIGEAGSKNIAGETGSLKVRFPRLILVGRYQRFIDLVCADTTLDHVFEDLVHEILGRIAGGKEPSTAVRGTLEDFRALLFPQRTPEIAVESLIGLLGELYVLSLLAERDPAAVDCWVGPLEMRHDFRTETHAIEVKTSRNTAVSEVLIHGIDQLLPPAGGYLLLAKVTLEPTPDGSIHLAGLFKALLTLGVSRQALLDRLSILGCEDPMDPAWNSRAFSLSALQAWEVTDDFPRITSEDIKGASLPSGVTRIQYSVDLSSAGKHLLGAKQTAAWLDEAMA